MLILLRPCSEWVLFLGAFLLTAAAVALFRKQRVYSFVVGLCLLAGLAHGTVYTHFRIQPQLDLDGREITVTGTVTDCSYRGSDVWRLTVDGRTESGTAVRIMLYSSKPVAERNTAEITCTAATLSDNALFSSTSFNSKRGVYLTAAGDAKVTDKGAHGEHFMRLASRLRDYTSKCIFAACDSESAALLQAIVCGDKSELSAADKAAMTRAGIGHIMAVSGTHLTVIVLLFSTIFCTAYIPKRLRTFLMLGIILLFMGFAGFSPSVTRAGIMLMLVQLSSLFGRRTDTLNSLGLCALVMALISPYAVTGAAFLLSMTSAAAIGAVTPKLVSRSSDIPHNSARSSLTASFAVLTATLPIQVLYFNEVSVISPITNLLLVPLCSAALGLLPFAMLLGGTTAAAQIILRICGLLVKLTLRCCTALSGYDFASVGGCHRIILAVAAVILVGLLSAALMYRSARLLVSGSVVLLAAVCMFTALSSYLARDTYRVVTLNNSSGTTAVIIRGHSAVILDIGSRGRHAYNLQELLSFYGVRRVESVFISSDSAGYVYTEEILPAAETVCTEFGSSGEKFSHGDTADMDGLTIFRAENGFEVSAYDIDLTLSRKRLSLPSGNIDFPVGGAILEVELAPDKAQLFELDDRFYKQHINQN